jgi:DNA-binding GntR family transcriptional regulator
MKLDSREYFERRELAERAAAENAASAHARRIHEELAQNYAELAQQLRGVAAPS